MQPADQPVVGEIAYATSFFGDSAARYFPAKALFQALWVGPYFCGAGFAGFVAKVDGAVVGYIIGAPDWAQYRRGLWRAVAEYLFSRPALSPLPACLPYKNPD